MNKCKSCKTPLKELTVYTQLVVTDHDKDQGSVDQRKVHVCGACWSPFAEHLSPLLFD